jgi:hypothetical protein
LRQTCQSAALHAEPPHQPQAAIASAKARFNSADAGLVAEPEVGGFFRASAAFGFLPEADAEL